MSSALYMASLFPALPHPPTPAFLQSVPFSIHFSGLFSSHGGRGGTWDHLPWVWGGSASCWLMSTCPGCLCPLPTLLPLLWLLSGPPHSSFCSAFSTAVLQASVFGLHLWWGGVGGGVSNPTVHTREGSLGSPHACEVPGPVHLGADCVKQCLVLPWPPVRGCNYLEDVPTGIPGTFKT